MKQAVLGLGNLLLGDEGVGVHAARALSADDALANVDVADVGTAILDAIPTLERADRIVVIDAVCAGEAPGTVYLFDIDDVEMAPVIGSMHGFDLCRVLGLCRRSDRPEVVVIGVEPDRIDWSMELSPAVASALPEVLEAVRRSLEAAPGAAPGLEEDEDMHAIIGTDDTRGRRARTRTAGLVAALAILVGGHAVAAGPDDGPPGPATAAPHPFSIDLRSLGGDPSPEPPPASPKAGVNGIGALLVAEGTGYSGVVPPDTVGAVGAGRYLQLVSARPSSLLTVRDAATAAVIAGPVALSDLWSGGGACAEGWGEPGVAFDHLADRWVVTERGAGNHLCVYVSQSDDPVAGGWFGYDIATPEFPDQPRLAVSADAFIVTTNESVPAVYALERSAMLTGQAAAWQRFEAPPLEGFGTQALTPARLSALSDTGSAPAPVVGRQVDGQAHGGVDRIELWQVQVDWQAPPSAGLLGPVAVAVGPFDSDLCGLGPQPCVPQPGTAQTLDPRREVLSSLELA
ncbi:MAG TPA: hydrogenase maturation protease, partial [Candidatus Sulfomarinibacteraceae bacterium]|nr:hydrogenase maturation protease [Candidatus Sulfomarinibacteraceae bacterium]